MNHIKQATDIGKSLRREREQQNISQLNLVQEAHVEQCSISHIENGRLNSTIDTLLNICKALHLKVKPVRE